MKFFQILTLCLSSLFALESSATIVRIQTNMGDVDVNLFDEATPETVTNFLHYLDAGAYSNTVIHRSVKGFVIQGGGFELEEGVISPVATVTSPPNEPLYSNMVGTIAMAKQGGDPDSATSQWFFNLANNSANLDSQNGGFTVFGQVTAGWEVVEAIAAIESFDLRSSSLEPIVSQLPVLGAFGATPLRNFTTSEVNALVSNPADFLVLVQSVTVIDPSADSANNLSPTLNTAILSNKGKKNKKWYASSDRWTVLLLMLGALVFGQYRRTIKHAS